MKLRMIRLGLTVAGNALGLWITSLLLGDDMSISGTAFVLAVVIFSVLTVVLEPVIGRLAEKYVDTLSGGAALISTGLALALTDWLSDGLSIDGVATWLLATVIVWVVTAVLAVVLFRLFAREATKQAAKR